MEIFQLKQSNSIYPSSLQRYFGRRAPAVISGMGNPDRLSHKKLGFFCSVKCPGHLILAAHDFAKELIRTKVSVISGFHSPIERECLRILLRGTQPVTLCPARCIQGMRIKSEYKKPLDKGRLLLLSPFRENQRRNSTETSTERNRFVAALADVIFIAHASPNSKTEAFCRELLSWGKPDYTLESDSNTNIINMGAKPVMIGNISDLLSRLEI